MKHLRCNPCRILGGVIGFAMVFVTIPMLFPPGTSADQAKLSRLVATMKVMQTECDDSELAGLLEYTSQTYDSIGRLNVKILHLEDLGAAAVNFPFVPGMSVDRWVWETLHDEYLIGLLLHEAMHDYYPYLGHEHMKHLVPVNFNENKYDDFIKS